MNHRIAIRSLPGIFFFAIVLLALGIGMSGCMNPITEIEETVDCNDLCSRYRDCYDDSYDVDACRNRCERYVDENDGQAMAANDCDACLDGRSCAGSFPCATECGDLIP